MKRIVIPASSASEAVWTILYNTLRRVPPSRRAEINATLQGLQELRAGAAFNTGSISMSAAWGLYAIANLFSPSTVIEIGTFIGRSTLALAYGMIDAGTGGVIHTCDSENDIVLPKVAGCEIRQHPRMHSTEMLRGLAGAGGGVDLLHVDGRLSAEDCALLAGQAKPHTVVVLDDFEGVEKGTVNAIRLLDAKIPAEARLILPPSKSLLQSHGFNGASTTALLLPADALGFN